MTTDLLKQIAANELSPELLSAVERFDYDLQIDALELDRHLPDVEGQYQSYGLCGLDDFHLIIEKPEGWFRRNVQIKGDGKKQLEKLLADPEVVMVFGKQRRFNEPGGWSDPNG